MSSWTLCCPNCRFTFVHSIIEVKETADYFLPTKPDFGAGGSNFRCSNCGHVALYQRSDLTYQA
jgi:hypothetical protein